MPVKKKNSLKKIQEMFICSNRKLAHMEELSDFIFIIIIINLGSPTRKRNVENTKNILSTFKINFKVTEKSRDLKTMQDSQ